MKLLRDGALATPPRFDVQPLTAVILDALRGGRLTPEGQQRAIEIAGVGRNLVRAVCGGIVLIGWWLLFFAPRPAFTLPVLISVASLSLTVGAISGTTNGKYDLFIIPFLVIVAVSIVTEVYRRLSPVRTA